MQVDRLVMGRLRWVHGGEARPFGRRLHARGGGELGLLTSGVAGKGVSAAL